MTTLDISGDKLKLNINPDLLKYGMSKGLNEREIVLFSMLFMMDEQYGGEIKGLIDWADDIGVINSKMCQVLIDYDSGNEEICLKHPLFVNAVSSSMSRFKVFLNELLEDGELNSRGHVNNPQDYTVINGSKLEEEAFNDIIASDPNIEFDIAKRVIVEYYEKVKPAKKLSNYILGGFNVDYITRTQ